MIPEWFLLWIERHRTAFSLTAEAWGESMVEWFKVFGPLGATEAEMNEASARCIRMSPTPRFTADHLDALKLHLSDLRVERRREFTDQARYESAEVNCCECADSGMVFVPHLQDVDRIEWQWLPYKSRGGEIRREMPVCCLCRKGQEAYNSLAGYAVTKNKPNPMSLGKYQTLNPRWRQMMADWREVRRAEMEANLAKEESSGDRNGWGELVRRIATRNKPRPAECEIPS